MARNMKKIATNIAITTNIITIVNIGLASWFLVFDFMVLKPDKIYTYCVLNEPPL